MKFFCTAISHIPTIPYCFDAIVFRRPKRNNSLRSNITSHSRQNTVPVTGTTAVTPPNIASFSNIHTVDTNDNSTVAIRFCKVLHVNWLVAKIIFGTIQIPCRLSYRYVSLLVIGLKVKQTFNCNETFGPIGMPIYIHIVQHSTRFVGNDHRPPVPENGNRSARPAHKLRDRKFQFITLYRHYPSSTGTHIYSHIVFVLVLFVE